MDAITRKILGTDVICGIWWFNYFPGIKNCIYEKVKVIESLNSRLLCNQTELIFEARSAYLHISSFIKFWNDNSKSKRGFLFYKYLHSNSACVSSVNSFNKANRY